MAATARVVRVLSVVLIGATIATTIGACDSRPRVPLSEVSLTGDTALSAAAAARADSEFVALMVPHHQHAIAMARVQLRFGRNYRLRRLAQEIMVTQQAEITALRNALDSAAVSTDGTAAASTGKLSSRDRVYAAEQFSNTVSVIEPATNKLLGVIRLGDALPGNLSPLYRGQMLVHGLGVSPDHRTLAVVSIGSNSVSFIDTPTNTVKHVTYVGRSPHEAFFTPDGREVWVTVRGESYVAVLDGSTYEEKTRIAVPNGPGMQVFSPDGRYGYVCSSFTPTTVVVSVAEHKIVGEVAQDSPFCPNIAATPDGKQVWLTLKDIGRTMVFDGRPPFAILRRLETGPITNHVNIVRNSTGTFAYVTAGGRNEVQVYRTDDFSRIATIPVGRLPHGVWPSGDGSRVYVGLENEDHIAVIDALTHTLLAKIPIGQAAQAVVYVPDAAPESTGNSDGDGARDGDGAGGTAGTRRLQPLGVAGLTLQLWMAATGLREVRDSTRLPTSVTLFDQGIQQVLQASVTGLRPNQPYVLALAHQPDGRGALEPLQPFTTNPAGAAIVNAVGPIRQIVRASVPAERRYLVIVTGTPARLGELAQVQVR